jgi:hypothetical protein
MFESWGGQLDVDRAAELAAAVAPRTNLHSILYDFERGRVYVRNQAWFRDARPEATDDDRLRLRAAAQPAAVIDLTRLFRGLRVPDGKDAAPTERAVVRLAPDAAHTRSGLPPPQIVRRDPGAPGR